MGNLRGCMTIIGAGAILFGLLLLAGVLFGYDPTGVSGRLGLNILLMVLFVGAFLAVGAGLIYGAYKMGKSEAR